MRVYIVAASDSEPDAERRLRWGDYWFKDSLGQAMERLGHELTGDVDRAEVMIVLHGGPVKGLPDWTYNILWVHSNPNVLFPEGIPERPATLGEIAAATKFTEINRFDRVFCESPLLAEYIIEAEHLPGASDMVPMDVPTTHDTVFVGNARGTWDHHSRPCVDAYLEDHPDGAGLEVWGENWEWLPDGCWQGLYYPHEKLNELYASSAHLITDSHAEMDEWHFTNPREYDMRAVNGDRVPTFDDVARTMLDGVRWSTKVDLGCGKHKRDGFIGLDVVDWPGVDVVADVRDPLHWQDGAVDYIIADNLMEHIGAPFLRVMNECRRVLRPGGRLLVVVPNVTTTAAFQDPTHVRFFCTETFDYFDRANPRWQAYGELYGIEPWDVVNVRKRDRFIEASLRKPHDG